MAGLAALPLCAALAAVFALALYPMWDFDVWLHLACGRALAEAGGIPSGDPFCFDSPAATWDSHEWLSQLVLYGLDRILGTAGLTVVKALGAAALAWLIFARGRLSNARDAWVPAAITVWAALAMRWFLTERPQMATYLLLAAELLVLERGKRLWPLVPMTFLWANLHGGASPLGPGVIALWAFGRALEASGNRDRRLLAMRHVPVCLASLAVICLNPSGPSLLAYPIRTMTDSFYLRSVREWTPPTPGELPVFFAFAALAAIILGLTIRRLSRPEILTIGVFALMAGTSRRHIPLFCIAAAPPLARGAADMIASLRIRPAFVTVTAIVLALLPPALGAVTGEALRLGVKREYYPAGALPALTAADAAIPVAGKAPQQDEIRLFSLHRWGGYLTWNLPGRWKTFIDQRQLVHGSERFRDYHRVLHDLDGGIESWRRIRADFAVLDYGSGLGNRLARGKEYALIHWDDTGLVYARRASRAGFLIRDREYRTLNPEREYVSPTPSALAEARRAALESPESARPLTVLASLLLARREPDRARKAADEALARAPRAAPVLLVAAQAALACGDLRAAESFIIGASRAGSPPAGIELARARLEFARQRQEEGRRRLLRAIRMGEENARRNGHPSPELGEARLLAGEKLAAIGKKNAAADRLRQAGNVFFEIGRHESARACYRRGLELAPRDVRLLHNLGTVLIATGRSREALAPLGRALELAPRHAEIRVTRGVAYYKLGMTALARREWERALILKPGHAGASSYLRALDGQVK